MSKYMYEHTKMPPYLPMPRFLLNCPISNTAKMLYIRLLGKAQLSQKNRWLDGQGRVYFIYPIHQMATDMNKSETTIKVLFVKFCASTFFTLFVAIIHKFFIIMQIPCSQFFKLFFASRKQLYTQFQDRYHFKSCTEIYSRVSNKQSDSLPVPDFIIKYKLYINDAQL